MQAKTRRQPQRISVQLPDDTLAELQREARRSGTSVAKAAQRVLEQGLVLLRRSELERKLREGYTALAEEHRELAREMDKVRSGGE